MAKNDLNSIQAKRPSSNRFDLSHDNKLTFNMGQLIPTTLLEVLPGDQFNITSEAMLRFAPMIAPIMHKVNCFTHFFFVPNRLLWSNWEKFITAANGASAEDIPPPPFHRFINSEGQQVGIPESSIFDYLGLPSNQPLPPVSALPFEAYKKVFQDYYMDQNLHPFAENLYDQATLENGVTEYDTATEIVDPFRRAWMHDYFTAALPWAQKGEQVTLPVGQLEDAYVYSQYSGYGQFYTKDVANTDPNRPVLASLTGTEEWNGNGGHTYSFSQEGAQGTGNRNFKYDPQGDLMVALGDANLGAATINDLRNAFRLQEWLEKMARGGSRYIEQILMHFGVRSSDTRLNRAEFLGGMKSPVIISEVLQTSDTSDQSQPLGSFAGHGISAGSTRNIRYRAEEHGYIIGIMSVMPTTAYFQGVPRHFSRESYLDYAWPTFAHIGEQAILNKELYTSGDDKNNEVFGYIPRYSEYRHKQSEVHGAFRSSMDFWHMARKFENRPVLNQQFVECNPTDRIFAVQNELNDQNIWGHVFHKISVRRKLPKFGTPTL